MNGHTTNAPPHHSPPARIAARITGHTASHRRWSRRAGCWFAGALLAVTAAVLFAGCGPQYPAVTQKQAEAGLADAMMVCATSLLLVMTADVATESRAATDDGGMVLEWRGIDRERGIGDYTVTLSDYRIPESSIFSAGYHGYRFTGTARMVSTEGRSTALTLDLTAAHPEAEQYPVQRIEVDVQGITSGGDGARRRDVTVAPGGEVSVNGREVAVTAFARLFIAVSE